MASQVKAQKITKRYAAYCGDSCEVIQDIPAESIGFSVFSPPFADLFAYSDSDADMGNCRSYEDFFKHFGFLVEELQRVMMQGRIVAVHCMDLPMYKNKGEEIGIRDFPGDIIRLFEKHGFILHSRHTIWKDPLIAATRTKAIGLAHKQIMKDSAMCRMGIPDYILGFRKPGENSVPIAHPEGLTELYGEREVPRYLDRFLRPNPETGKWWTSNENLRSQWIWQQYASPVWFDIRQTKVLQYKQAKDKEDERHVCPLQLDVIRRCLVLWSAPDDTVFTPFMGVGSEVYCAVEMGRKGIGCELKKSYYRMAVKNLESLDTKKRIRENSML